MRHTSQNNKVKYYVSFFTHITDKNNNMKQYEVFIEVCKEWESLNETQSSGLENGQQSFSFDCGH